MITSLLRRTLDHARSNVIAYLALFVALAGARTPRCGGGGHGGSRQEQAQAEALAANSVGTKQLKNGAVTASKLNVHVISLSGPDGAARAPGAQGSQGPARGQGRPR